MKILTVPVRLFYPALVVICSLMIGCSKSNYLEVGQRASVIDSQGIYMRSAPNPQARKVVLIPVGKKVNVLAEGLPEKLYDIKSKWYRVAYGKYEGWMWGGLAKSDSSPNGYSRANGNPSKVEDIAGTYSDGKHVLEIRCDGTIRQSWADAGDRGEDRGQIEGAEFKFTSSSMSLCSGNNCERHTKSVDNKVHKVSIADHMKNFELTSRKKCD